MKVLSRFAHSASHTHHALFNALNLELVYGTDALKTLVDDFQQPRDEAAYLAQAPRQRALLETLVKLGMLVDPGDDNRQLVQANVARLERPSPVTSMYLVPTRHCNIRCQYCTFAEGRVSAEQDVMTVDEARAAIDVFFSYATKNDLEKDVCFFGGEPLLHFDVVQAAVAHVKARSAQHHARVNVSMFTNAMLMTEDIARFLSANDVFLIVSLDGRPERHDKARCHSYAQVSQNLKLARRLGCRVGVSMVLSKHNVDTIVEDLEHVLTEFEPVDVGINCTLHGSHGAPNPLQVDPAVGTAKLIECYKVLRERGVYFEHLLRRVRPFVLKQPRLRDCPAGGGKLVFVPGGQVGVCEAFAASGRYFYDAKDFSFDRPEIADWKHRSPLRHDACHDCVGVGVCGGGCAYDVDNRHGTINAMGDDRCVQTRVILDWILEDVGQRVDLAGADFVVPGEAARKGLLERMAMHDGTLPMHNYSTFGEDGHR